MNFPDEVPDLEGDLVWLREPREEDIAAWFERATDAESAALAGDPIPESIAMGTAWLERHRTKFREKKAIRWVICLKGATASIGSIGLSIISKEQGTAEIGAVVGRAFWGRGIASAAAQAVIRFGFGSLGLSEIRAELLQSNLASIHVLEKLGFHLSDVIPDFETSDAGPEDGFLYILHAARTNGSSAA